MSVRMFMEYFSYNPYFNLKYNPIYIAFMFLSHKT